jgi:hypothetical protein
VAREGRVPVRRAPAPTGHSLPIKLTGSQFALGRSFTNGWIINDQHSFDGIAECG